MRKVAAVLNAEIKIIKSNPPQWSINAIGVVPSNGWTNPRLVPCKCVLPPDGILDLDFVADPPGGINTQPVSAIVANEIWHDPPERAKGVRIFAETNQLEVLVEQATKVDCTFP